VPVHGTLETEDCVTNRLFHAIQDVDSRSAALLGWKRIQIDRYRDLGV